MVRTSLLRFSGKRDDATLRSWPALAMVGLGGELWRGGVASARGRIQNQSGRGSWSYRPPRRGSEAPETLCGGVGQRLRRGRGSQGVAGYANASGFERTSRDRL